MFQYSALPGRWATPIIGAFVAVGSLIGASMAAAHRMPEAAWLSVSAPVFVLLFGSTTMRWGTRIIHGPGRSGVNLVGWRGVPSVWLMAHLDTKGQPVPLALRAGGLVLVGVGWLVTLAGWIVYALGSPIGTREIVAGLVVAGVGALPLAGSIVLDRGTGALDNASGIASIFETIDSLDPDFPVGVVVTTAEELALAGARAWAASWRCSGAPGIVVNCDGVDDEGQIICIVGRDSGGRLAGAIERGREVAGTTVRVRRSLPGVLFDSVALAEAGWDTMTVTRGTLRSLARVHTAGDTLAAWSGGGVAGVAAFLAAAAGAIVAEQHGDHPARREE